MISLRDLLTGTDRAYAGMGVSGSPIVTVIDSSRVYNGMSVSGTPLYTVVGNKFTVHN
jgi:hypothetical protein